MENTAEAARDGALYEYAFCRTVYHLLIHSGGRRVAGGLRRGGVLVSTNSETNLAGSELVSLEFQRTEQLNLLVLNQSPEARLFSCLVL